MFFADNEHVELASVANELGISAKTAMNYISRRQCSAIKLLVFNITKKTKQHSFFNDKETTYLEDVTHSMWYIPANPQVVEDILRYGEYKASCHIVTFPTQEGMTEETYIPTTPGAEADHEIKATIDTLYITGHHARVLEQHVQAKRAEQQKTNNEINAQVENKSRSKLKDKTIPQGGLLTPNGTEWSDITFRFMDHDRVTITFDGQDKERRFTSFDFSCKTKNKKPTKPWMHLLNLALHKGNPPIPIKPEDEITTKHVSLIRGGLKSIFPGVEGDPIGKHKSGEGWPLHINLCVSQKMYEQLHQ